MVQPPHIEANIDSIATWAKYSPKLCRHCAAGCCRLPVEVMAHDLVRMKLVDTFELESSLKYIARRLLKSQIIEHFHSRSGTFTLARRANGDCLYLDEETRRCTIYDMRPETCRNHPRIGPRPGYCAYKRKSLSKDSIR